MQTRLPIVEEVLEDHASALGPDRIAYRNYVYRVVNLCLMIAGDRHIECEKLALAAVFHDLGIWTNNTFDYIAPSVAVAREYLTTRGTADWIPEIEAMIVDHHKVTTSRANPRWLVESFRRARWPDAGFHRRLVELTVDRWRKHPLNPLPMVKW